MNHETFFLSPLPFSLIISKLNLDALSLPLFCFSSPLLISLSLSFPSGFFFKIAFFSSPFPFRFALLLFAISELYSLLFLYFLHFCFSSSSSFLSEMEDLSPLHTHLSPCLSSSSKQFVMFSLIDLSHLLIERCLAYKFVYGICLLIYLSIWL
ncbi:hypothetical protein CPC08DRAFT_245714 [Agrocybe pediades]|nr:hypothetical protein CPC08DRAFT_245714 [Agrocybe pediades]